MRKQKLVELNLEDLEEGSDFLGGEGAAVSELAGLDVLDLSSELGSGRVLEFGRLNGDLLAGQELGDDVELGGLHAAGGQGADETTEALLGLTTFDVGDHGEGGFFEGNSRLLGLSLVVSAASEESS